MDIANLNKSFIDIVQNYTTINSKLAIKKNIIETDTILSNDIIILQVSMNDLAIQLQNINFKIDCIQDETPITPIIPAIENNTAPSTDTIPLDLNTDKLINKTINEMLPLFMLGLMNNDKNSLLNSNTFMNNIKNTFNTLLSSMPPSAQSTNQMNNIANTLLAKSGGDLGNILLANSGTLLGNTQAHSIADDLD